MKALIEPGSLDGRISGPPSKSMTQRAYAAALLHKGITVINGAGQSADELAALQIIQQLGAKLISQTERRIEISSNGVNPISESINCAESGLAARLFTPIASLCEKAIKIEGTGSLLHRPMDGFREALPFLGVALEGFNGKIPFSVQGPMVAKSFKINAEGGSQFISGLLFALSHCATSPVTLEVTGLKSKPYIDLTLEVLEYFGKPIAHNKYKTFIIDPALFTKKDTIEINIETDWSSAACLLVAGAIGGNITVQNLNFTSKQADRAIIDVLRNAGADMHFDNDSVSIKCSPLAAFEFDATHCPDLFPALSILAACSEGNSYIAGVHRLFYKESNRVESVTQMLQDFDVPYSVENDTLCISGVRHLQGTIIDSYHDHRIVMAAAIGALRANGPVDITFADCVSKSYPAFFKDLSLCGGIVTFNEDDI